MDTSLSAWTNYFMAVAGATAALAGLLFVSLSINLKAILAIRGMAARAGETFMPLGVLLILSLMALNPMEKERGLAWGCLLLGSLVWLATVWIQIGAFRAGHFQRAHHFAIRVGLLQPATLCVPLAGALMLAGHPDGLGWFGVATGFSFASAMVNAWIMLVEIVR